MGKLNKKENKKTELVEKKGNYEDIKGTQIVSPRKYMNIKL
jgi:hypothetical protein